MRGSGQRGIKSRAQFVEGQSALREVLTQGRGSRVPVSIASAHARCWCLMILRGYLGQLPQHGGVAVQGGPALAGEGDCGLRFIAAGRPHVSGVAQLAQADDRAAGGSPIMACSRVTDSASPSGSAARVATMHNRSGSWISGSSTPVLTAVPYRSPSRSRRAWV